ncbi:hypothetical protein EYF80_011386 [Liparis tanakae]|uniref:Uncharacterized protein n=1 Tax=Liparis tanakae TaxID=230148 RepID=A0A4Z2IMH4_9TELE|nr:hypothetical protein EYF80_011386 [Liparis tanakae]
MPRPPVVIAGRESRGKIFRAHTPLPPLLFTNSSSLNSSDFQPAAVHLDTAADPFCGSVPEPLIPPPVRYLGRL